MSLKFKCWQIGYSNLLSKPISPQMVFVILLKLKTFAITYNIIINTQWKLRIFRLKAIFLLQSYSYHYEESLNWLIRIKYLITINTTYI